MSSMRLVTKIKDTPGIPGKYKRVLEAWAAFANDNGSNIYCSKESAAKKAGISRDTVYQNTAALLKLGVMVPASSHKCKTPGCNGGSTHFTGKSGHYTTAYDIAPGFGQNTQRWVWVKQLNLGLGKTIRYSNATPISSRELGSALTSGKEKDAIAIAAAMLSSGQTEKEKSKSNPEEFSFDSIPVLPNDSIPVLPKDSLVPESSIPPVLSGDVVAPVRESAAAQPISPVPLAPEARPTPSPAAPRPFSEQAVSLANQLWKFISPREGEENVERILPKWETYWANGVGGDD